MSMIPPPAQMVSKAQSRNHPIFSSASYETWLFQSGTQVLYIDGPNARSNIEAAEQISFDWMRRRAASDGDVFSFLFDSRDPLRNSMRPFLAAAFLHFFLERGGEDGNIEYFSDALKDQYKLQHAWLDQDMVNLTRSTYTWMSESTPLLLLRFDECNRSSREALWGLFGDIASKTEEPVKIVLTSRVDGRLGWFDVLQDELRRWPEINLLRHTILHDEDSPVETSSEDDTESLYYSRLISHLCPRGWAKSEVTKSLHRFKFAECAMLRSSLQLLEKYSRWPAEQSRANLDLFCSLLEQVSADSTPQSTLTNILQSIPDHDWLQWLLTWTLFGQRPLTSLELSMLLHSSMYTRTSVGVVVEPARDDDIAKSWKKINSQLRGFIELHDNGVMISKALLDVWDKAEGQLINTVKLSAFEATAEFLLHYLASSQIKKKLDDLYVQYQEVVERSDEGFASPLMPDGRDAIFYAVQALPYHLANITISELTQKSMRDTNGPYKAWAQVFWAMSNPLSRSEKGPLKSAWVTWETSSYSKSSKAYLIHEQDIEEDGQVESEETPMDRLIAAVRADDENSSVVLAEQVLAEFKAHAITHNTLTTPDKVMTPYLPWPPSILWRAVFMGMNRLLDLLLRSGVPRQVDDNSAVCRPSLLHLAAVMGNSSTVDLLIQNGADITILRNDLYTALTMACSRGDPDTTRALLEKDSSMLEKPQPVRPLYQAAAWGCWKVLPIFLRSGAEPDFFRYEEPASTVRSDQLESHKETVVVPDWTPLTAACLSGYLKTARILLEYGADPNKYAFETKTLPLHFSSVDAGSPELVRLLLKHKADPNHSLLDPPILTAIIRKAQLSDETKTTIFNLLLDNVPAVQVDKPDAQGQTALMAAARLQDMAAIQWLLEHGADINAVDLENQHALFWAVIENKYQAVESLLNHREKPRLEQTSSLGISLIQAARIDIRIFEKLVDAGADLKYEGHAGQTVLNTAVVNEDVDIVKFLLSLGPDRNVDIHHRDSARWTPILDATGFKPNVEITRVLMEHGSRLSDTNGSNDSPLHLAARSGQPDLLRVLLEYRTSEDLTRLNDYGNTPLLAISEFKNTTTLECVKLLVRAGADVNAQDKNGWSVLMTSATFGPEAREIHEYLLSQSRINGKLTTNTGITALHLASQYCDVELVAKLLEQGADANVRCVNVRSTPLIAACIPVAGDAAVLENVGLIVRDLISHDALVDSMLGTSLYSPLCAASLYAGVGVIKCFLDQAASVHKMDPLGRFPIHFAAANGMRNFEYVANVHGDDIMVNDRFDKNILHWAAEFGHVETVRWILQKISPEERERHINAEDVDGWTPLAWACRPTSMDAGYYWMLSEAPDFALTIQCLLDHGADKSSTFYMNKGEKWEEEFTPLKMARRCGLADDVLELLQVEEPKSNEVVDASRNESKHKVLYDEKKYRRTNASCDFCFSVRISTVLLVYIHGGGNLYPQGESTTNIRVHSQQIWGIYWTCLSCEDGQYVLCKKCYPRGQDEHRKTVADRREGEEHSFEIKEHASQEFEDTSSPTLSEKALSAAGSDTGTASTEHNSGNQQEEDEVAPGDNGESEIGELDFPDLNDL